MSDMALLENKDCLGTSWENVTLCCLFQISDDSSFIWILPGTFTQFTEQLLCSRYPEGAEDIGLSLRGRALCTWVLESHGVRKQGVPKPLGHSLSSGVHHKKHHSAFWKSGSPMISAWYSYKDMIDNLKLTCHSSVFHWDVNKTLQKCQLVNLSW